MNLGIRAQPRPRCILCDAAGEPLYAGLRDRLFSAPGEWSHRRCTNPRCRLIWLDPMPRAEDIHLAYASYYTHARPAQRSDALGRFFAAAKSGYLAQRFGYSEGVSAAARIAGLLAWLYPGRPAELDFSVMWLPASARGRLLDVGAGSGWLVEQMAALGWKTEGLDFDARSVASARARGLTMHAGGLAEQGFPEACFDAVTMAHSIEHVHDPVGWLAEARRILRAGGRLVLATPNAHSLLHRRFGADWFALDPPRHLHLFNRSALEAALQAAGFGRFRLFTSIRDANGAWLGSRAIRRNGSFDMTAAQPTAAKLAARAVQLFELGVKVLDADAGEDLIALAER